MPHLRPRYLAPLLSKASGLSPLTGVLGHRQVGKTTLLSALASNYLTLDDPETYRAAKADPRAFLDSNAALRTGIDECQLLPSLFPALKERVRKTSRPGLYLLSGSVRFTSRAAIRESLTGRIVNLELLPFTVGELEQEELADSALRILAAPDLTRLVIPPRTSARRKRMQALMEKYLGQGGLPGVCFIRDEAFRARKTREQLQTILDRDVRMVYPTSLPYRQMLDYVETLAASQGLPLSFSDLRRETGISPITQRKLLGALEAVYLLRLLPLGGHRKGFSVWFEDQAEALILSRRAPTEVDQWVGLAYRHIRTQFAYRLGLEARVSQFYSTSGNTVPFVIESAAGTIGFIPTEGPAPSRNALGTAQSFLRVHANSKAVIFHPGLGGEGRAYDARTWVSPLVDLI